MKLSHVLSYISFSSIITIAISTATVRVLKSKNKKGKKSKTAKHKKKSAKKVKHEEDEMAQYGYDDEVNDFNSNCPVFTQDPTSDSGLQRMMLEATKPCGHYRSQGYNYEVIPHNVVHPGEGVGDLDFKPYIVQFDIGVHPNIINRVTTDHANYGKEKRGCIGCGEEGEQCLEIIVKGQSGATGGCAGKCGLGCVIGAGWAKDCMKHDVVSILPFVYCHFSNSKVN